MFILPLPCSLFLFSFQRQARSYAGKWRFCCRMPQRSFLNPPCAQKPGRGYEAKARRVTLPLSRHDGQVTSSSSCYARRVTHEPFFSACLSLNKAYGGEEGSSSSQTRREAPMQTKHMKGSPLEALHACSGHRPISSPISIPFLLIHLGAGPHCVRPSPSGPIMPTTPARRNENTASGRNIPTVLCC